MKKLFCFICDKYRKLEKPKIFCLLVKTFVFPIIYNKCKNEEEEILIKKIS